MHDDTLRSVLITDRQHRLRRDATDERLTRGAGEQRRWWRRVPHTTPARSQSDRS